MGHLSYFFSTAIGGHVTSHATIPYAGTYMHAVLQACMQLHMCALRRMQHVICASISGASASSANLYRDKRLLN